MTVERQLPRSDDRLRHRRLLHVRQRERAGDCAATATATSPTATSRACRRDTPACYATQFWEHVPIEQQGVFTGGNVGGFIQRRLHRHIESTLLADVNNDGKLDILCV